MSPDLFAPDYFLWGHLKAKVYANKCGKLMEVRENVRDEIRANEKRLLGRISLCHDYRNVLHDREKK
jgi:hypothetical protein